MPVQVFNPQPVPSTASNLGSALGGMLSGAMQGREQSEQQDLLSQALFGDKASQFKKLPVKVQLALQKAMTDAEKNQMKSRLLQQIFPQEIPQGLSPGEDVVSDTTQQIFSEPGKEGPRLTDEQRAAVALVDPNLAKVLESQEKDRQKRFEGERKYHTAFSSEAEKKIENLRETLPRKESALDFARNAVESGDVGAFSLNRMGQVIGGPAGDALQSAKGAQLTIAGKENLLSNMARTSARAQNLWFEQRLNSMFAKTGQTEEANLTTQEMLEGEINQEKAFLDMFDKLADQDMKNFGYVKKDINKRVDKELKPIRKQIFDRSVYRMKEIEENEKGLKKLKKEVGKKVPRGTPLTVGMAKLYHEKFGDKSLDMAKKNGYTVPTIEEFQIYQLRPKEYREKLNDKYNL